MGRRCGSDDNGFGVSSGVRVRRQPIATKRPDIERALDAPPCAYVSARRLQPRGLGTCWLLAREGLQVWVYLIHTRGVAGMTIKAGITEIPDSEDEPLSSSPQEHAQGEIATANLQCIDQLVQHQINVGLQITHAESLQKIETLYDTSINPQSSNSSPYSVDTGTDGSPKPSPNEQRTHESPEHETNALLICRDHVLHGQDNREEQVNTSQVALHSEPVVYLSSLTTGLANYPNPSGT